MIVEQGVHIVARYNGHVVGTYEADLFVEKKVIVELKAISMLADIHEVQLLNYLRATDFEAGLLINFGVKLDVKRKIFRNERKKSFSASIL